MEVSSIMFSMSRFVVLYAGSYICFKKKDGNNSASVHPAFVHMYSKAGPGTIAEACTRGLPVILSSFLPGQVSQITIPTHPSSRVSYDVMLFCDE